MGRDQEVVLVLRGVDPRAAAPQITDIWRSIECSAGPILFKPNLISHRHMREGDYSTVVTQPEVLELAWSVADKLGLIGQRYVADAPQGDADFNLIVQRTGLASWREQRNTTLIDLRTERYIERDGVPIRHERLVGDPSGCIRVDLGRDSAFFDSPERTYYGADFDIAETNAHHFGEKHEYLFSGTALGADIVINLPKLKTHKKAGVTISLKNLVGLNGNKNWLPHHSMGTPKQGGDAYPESTMRQELEAGMARFLKPLISRSGALRSAAVLAKPIASRLLGETNTVVRSGNWWGNDTIWRMILDLNRILLYARLDGTIASEPQRRMISLVDGLVAGEAHGPEAPDRVDAGLLIAGMSPLAVDLVSATLMGFDWQRIPHLAEALKPHRLPLGRFAIDDIVVQSNMPQWDRRLVDISPESTFRFRPHFGWAGQIERRPSEGVEHRA